MSHYNSITDLLTAHGYALLDDAEGAYFYKAGHRIRAEELTGLTVESAVEKWELGEAQDRREVCAKCRTAVSGQPYKENQWWVCAKCMDTEHVCIEEIEQLPLEIAADKRDLTDAPQRAADVPILQGTLRHWDCRSRILPCCCGAVIDEFRTLGESMATAGKALGSFGSLFANTDLTAVGDALDRLMMGIPEDADILSVYDDGEKFLSLHDWLEYQKQKSQMP